MNTDEMPGLPEGERVLRCPRCQGRPLEDFEAAPGVVVDMCTGCRGMFLDHGEIDRVVGVGAAASEAISASYKRAMIDGPACVACGDVPFEDWSPRVGEGVQLFGCPRCRAVWVDGGVLPRFREALLRERTRVAGVEAERARVLAVDAAPADRLPFDLPIVNWVALPIALTIGFLMSLGGFGRSLAALPQIQFHELGHALVAISSGRFAVPLPIGFTFWREEKSMVFAAMVALLLIGLFVWSARGRHYFVALVAAAAFVFQLSMTLVVAGENSLMWAVFGGIAGEFVLSALAMTAFYYPAPDRWRWDFWRFVVLIPAAICFVNSLMLWRRLQAGVEKIQLTSLFGTPGDGSSDLERLIAYGWTGPGLADVYVSLGFACGGIVLAHYVVFAVRSVLIESGGSRSARA